MESANSEVSRQQEIKQIVHVVGKAKAETVDGSQGHRPNYVALFMPDLSRSRVVKDGELTLIRATYPSGHKVEVQR